MTWTPTDETSVIVIFEKRKAMKISFELKKNSIETPTGLSPKNKKVPVSETGLPINSFPLKGERKPCEQSVVRIIISEDCSH